MADLRRGIGSGVDYHSTSFSQEDLKYLLEKKMNRAEDFVRENLPAIKAFLNERARIWKLFQVWAPKNLGYIPHMAVLNESATDDEIISSVIESCGKDVTTIKHLFNSSEREWLCITKKEYSAFKKEA